MKKLINLTLASAALISVAASCSSEEPGNIVGDGKTMFTVELPAGVATRAFADGETAKNLTYVVYTKGTTEVVTTGTETFTDLKATVSVDLVKGIDYDIVFWAQGDNAPYTLDTATAAVTVDYDNYTCNSDENDAFYASLSLTGGLSAEQTVTLYRPFAQLNIGTSDYNDIVKKAYPDGVFTSVSVNVSSSLNLKTGEVDTPAAHEFAVTVMPSEDETFPVEGGYTYLSMNYILVPADQTIGDIDINMYTSATSTTAVNTIKVPNAPMQRNYRTNIYGKLLTTTTDFNVEINPVFEEPANNISMTVSTPEQFMAALKENATVIVPEGATIDLSQQNDGGEIELPNGSTLKVEGTINTARSQLAVKDGNTVTVLGPGKITSTGETGNRPLNAYDGGTLVVRNVTVETDQNNGGSSIYSENGNLDLENVTVNCHHFAIGANGGTITAKDCEFNSDSNNKEGNWSYTVMISSLDDQPCDGVFDNCVVTGIQGGFTVSGEGTVMTLNNCTVTLSEKEGYASGTSYWPIYATNKGQVIVNSGKYYTPNPAGYGALAGDNDVDMPDGNIVLRGGEFCGMAYNTSTKEIIKPATGYVYKAIEGSDLYKWEVVKE